MNDDDRAREARLRAGGVDPDQLRAKAQAELARVTPPGWSRQQVVPPWASVKSGHCRACGGGQHWHVTLLTRLLPEARKVLFTFASVCDDCVDDPDKRHELADRAFGPQ